MGNIVIAVLVPIVVSVLSYLIALQTGKNRLMLLIPILYAVIAIPLSVLYIDKAVDERDRAFSALYDQGVIEFVDKEWVLNKDSTITGCDSLTYERYKRLKK